MGANGGNGQRLMSLDVPCAKGSWGLLDSVCHSPNKLSNGDQPQYDGSNLKCPLQYITGLSEGSLFLGDQPLSNSHLSSSQGGAPLL